MESRHPWTGLGLCVTSTGWRCLAGTAICTPIHLCLRARPLRVTDHLPQVLMTGVSALHATKYIYRPRLGQSAGGRCARPRRMRSRKARWKQQQGSETGGGDRGRMLSRSSDGSHCHISGVKGTNTRQTEPTRQTWVPYKNDKTISNMAKERKWIAAEPSAAFLRLETRSVNVRLQIFHT